MMPAIPYVKTATTDGIWNAGTNTKRLPQKKSALRAAHAWVDAAGDPNTKGAYKCPHHEVHGNGTVGAANLRACASIIAALNGGRGGATIPDSDRAGVYAHVAGHLKAAGQAVPDLKSLEQIDLEARFGADVEIRVIPHKVELRTAADGTQQLDGYGAVFNQETVIGGGLWGFRERVAPGAFTESIKSDDIRGLFNHNPDYVLGRNMNGTLHLDEDGVGLHYVIDLNAQDPDAVRVGAKINRGDVSQSSFAFTIGPNGDAWDFADVKNGKLPLRTITRATLYDVSPVTYPAYPQTSVSARAQQMATRHITRDATDTDDGNQGDDGDGGGTAGGGDGGVSAASKTLVGVAHRDLMTAHQSVRKALSALGVTGVPDQDASPLTGPGGSKLDTGRSTRDAGGNSAMYYAGQAMHHATSAAVHSSTHLRAICRDADSGDGDGDGGDGADGSGGGDAGAMGGDAGANAAAIDIDLRSRELELERLR